MDDTLHELDTVDIVVQESSCPSGYRESRRSERRAGAVFLREDGCQ